MTHLISTVSISRIAKVSFILIKLGVNISTIVYYIKLGTITITQCKAIDLSSFDIPAVPKGVDIFGILSKSGGPKKLSLYLIINIINIH